MVRFEINITYSASACLRMTQWFIISSSWLVIATVFSSLVLFLIEIQRNCYFKYSLFKLRKFSITNKSIYLLRIIIFVIQRNNLDQEVEKIIATNRPGNVVSLQGTPLTSFSLQPWTECEVHYEELAGFWKQDWCLWADHLRERGKKKKKTFSYT